MNKNTEAAKSLKFFTFTQNNSGGSFDFDIDNGITHYVVIQAKDEEAARKAAKKIGIYFDGVDSGRDCACCGDRWFCYNIDVYDQPMVYSQPVDKAEDFSQWMDEGREICVHYTNGKKEWFGIKKRGREK